MPPSTIRRLTFDLDSTDDRPQERLLFEQDVTTFTRIDDRFLGRQHRYIFVQYVDRQRPFRATLPNDPRSQPVNSIARFDVRTGERRTFFAGEAHVVQEPCFVPRSAASPEGDGYLLATVHNLAAMRAELAIVDAVSMTETGRVILPFRNAMQVHGAWAADQELPLA